MNKRNRTLALSTVVLLTFSLILGSFYLVSAESTEDDNVASNSPTDRSFGWRHGGMFSFLDEEQRTELQEIIEAMREDGDSCEEIREFIRAYLEEKGFEPIRPELTEEQLEALDQLRSDVQEYAEKRAEELGIDLPQNGGFRFFRRGRRTRWHVGSCFPKMEEN